MQFSIKQMPTELNKGRAVIWESSGPNSENETIGCIVVQQFLYKELFTKSLSIHNVKIYIKINDLTVI